MRSTMRKHNITQLESIEYLIALSCNYCILNDLRITRKHFSMSIIQCLIQGVLKLLGLSKIVISKLLIYIFTCFEKGDS